MDAQLSAANIPHELFDAIVSADVFERLKPAPGARHWLYSQQWQQLAPDACMCACVHGCQHVCLPTWAF